LLDAYKMDAEEKHSITECTYISITPEVSKQPPITLLSKGLIIKIPKVLWREVFSFFTQFEFETQISKISRFFQSFISSSLNFLTFLEIDDSVITSSDKFARICTFPRVKRIKFTRFDHYITKDPTVGPEIFEILKQLACLQRVRKIEITERFYSETDKLYLIIAILKHFPKLTSLNLFLYDNQFTEALALVNRENRENIPTTYIPQYKIDFCDISKQIINHPTLKSLSLCVETGRMENIIEILLIPTLTKVKFIKDIEIDTTLNPVYKKLLDRCRVKTLKVGIKLMASDAFQ
jgi:hypothetical protein